MEADSRTVSYPNSFAQLLTELMRGYLRNFFKNTLKAVLATAFVLLIPEILNYFEANDLLNDKLINLLRDFVISPQNTIKGCLLSSIVVLTGISFVDKVWFIGIGKSIFIY